MNSFQIMVFVDSGVSYECIRVDFSGSREMLREGTGLPRPTLIRVALLLCDLDIWLLIRCDLKNSFLYLKV